MLELEDISFSVSEKRKKRQILKDVSFSVKPGEFIIITGPNGSGKSTLARTIAGINSPDSGKIYFKKEDITGLGCTERARRGISYAFQQPVIFKGLTIRDLLQIAISGDESLYEDAPKAINSILEKVGLSPEVYLDREVDSSLSGGELKRIELASVLARNTPLSIFDEPEAGIDIWSFNNLVKVFKSIHKDMSKRSIIIISHQRRLMEIADRIIVLKDGEIINDGSADKIIAKLETLL